MARFRRRRGAIPGQAGQVFARLLCLALTFFPTAALAADALRILFIGNSYTAQNNVPGLFSDIVASTGEPRPVVKSRTPGGRTLRQHLGDPEALKLVDAGDWNVMVLQAQSQEPAMAEINEGIASDFLEGGTGLCRRFQAGNPGGRIVLYQTWARHADLWRVDQRAEALGTDPAAMQSRNRRWYAALAERVPNCIVAPVGDAWQRNDGLPTPLRLHGNDHSHPTRAGSYLAALVIYGIVYKPARLDVPFRGPLPESEATVLQTLAAETLGDAAKRPQP